MDLETSTKLDKPEKSWRRVAETVTNGKYKKELP